MPSVAIYDTSSRPVSDVYNQAIDLGAEMVIGPLRQSQVEELVSAPELRVPTLTLNRLDTQLANSPDNLVQFRAMDCDNLMTHLDNSMDLDLRLHHFILPNHDSRVIQDARRLALELTAKSKKESKAAGSTRSQRKKIDEEDEEEEGSNKSNKKPKWHSIHEQLWVNLFHSNPSEHPELSQVSWSLQAAESIPAAYQGNPWYESMAVRNRDIVRIMDLKLAPDLLKAEIMVDLTLCLSYVFLVDSIWK